MDINEIGSSYKPNFASSTKMNKAQGFNKILDGKIADINATTPLAAIDTNRELLEHSHEVINLLDDYARELTDPSKTLKDMGPLVENIKKEMSLIEAEAAQINLKDNELERLINDLAVTANVALFKFYRGDYI